jgi:hypothetical protein
VKQLEVSAQRARQLRGLGHGGKRSRGRVFDGDEDAADGTHEFSSFGDLLLTPNVADA